MEESAPVFFKENAMNYKEFNISLPVSDNNVYIVDGIIQYDTANIFNVRLMEGTEAFDFTGYTNVFIEIVKPDGTHIQSCVTDNPDISNDNNPYVIQVVDAKDGRISFELSGQATLLNGTHFGQIMISGGGKILTSARINYYVGDTLQYDSDPDDVASLNEYSSLRNMINQNSAIATEERTRVDAETQRMLAELQRAETIEQQVALVQHYLSQADSYVAQTEANMELAQQYAQLAQNPSLEIMQSLISSLDLASETYVDSAVSGATKDFDAGAYTDTEENEKLLKVRRGTATQEIVLDEGELGFSTDTRRAYIGTGTENLPLNGVFVAQNTAPEETHILWVDTSAGGVIKYYDGAAWQPTATATFS